MAMIFNSLLAQIDVSYLLTQGFNGLVLGMIYALIAIGLSIIFGTMGIINFAHGDLLLIGAYIAWLLSGITGNFFVGLIGATLFVGFVGIAIERLTLQRIYDYDPLLILLLTFGIAEVIRGTVIFIWGRSGKSFPIPQWGKGAIDFLLFTYPRYRLFVILFGAAIIIMVYIFLNYTDLGLIVRAGADDRQMVNALGINISFLFMVVFGLGAAVAGIAGALIAPIRGVAPQLGINLLIPAFVVVVMGGVGSFRGSIVAGIIVGEIIVITGVIYTPASQVIIYIAMAAILLVRPQGLFGQTTGVE